MAIDDPKVTVLMPAYNADAFIGDSIKSILRQSLQEFELIVIDDGSTDHTASIINGFTDRRICYFRNDSNRGIVYTLNRGLGLARGELIARMDADDISRRDRLEKQVDFMETKPEIGVSGTWRRLIGDQPPLIDRAPVGAEIVSAYMVFDNPLYHPSVIMRRQWMQRHNLRYDPEFSRTEDFDLWSRAARRFALDNLPKPLLKFRCHTEGISGVAADEMTRQTEKILRRELRRMDIDPTDRELAFHHRLSRGYRFTTIKGIERAHSWIRKILGKNEIWEVHPKPAIQSAASMIWFRLCRNSTPLGLKVLKTYRSSFLSKAYIPPLMEYLRFLMSIFWHKIRERKEE